MKNGKKGNDFTRALKSVYLKLFRINDTPHRIAMGFGLGVFLGILPGTGPLASLFLSTLLRVNKASAVLGSLMTNTWLSAATFLLSIKIGSAILKSTNRAVQIMAGYVVIGLCAGLVAYCAVRVVQRIRKHEDKSRTDISR